MGKIKKNILIVDDNHSFAYFISELLKLNGDNVICLNTIEEATRYLKNCQPPIEIALIDFQVGRHSSQALAEEIKQKYPTAYTIMMSAASSKKDKLIESLISNKIIDNFLKKPFTFKQLQDLMAKC